MYDQHSTGRQQNIIDLACYDVLVKPLTSVDHVKDFSRSKLCE